VKRYACAAFAIAISACNCDESIGRLEGELEVTPTSLDFGEVPVGGEKQLDLTLKNLGSAKLTVESFSVGAPFIAPSGTASVAPAFPRTVKIGFRPTTVGPSSGVLTIREEDPEAPEVEVSVRGVGIEAAVVVDPLTVDFGEVLWNSSTTPQTRMISVSNAGSDGFDLTAIELAEDAGGAFTVDAGMAIRSYAPRSSDTFTVSYMPNSMGSVTGSVRIKTTAPTAPEIIVSLRASAVGPEMDLCVQVTGGGELCASRGEMTRLDFGVLTLNGRATGQIAIKNIGTRDLTAQGMLQGQAPDFMFMPSIAPLGEVVISPGQAQRIDVAYTANDYVFDSVLAAFGSNGATRRSGVVRLEARIAQADINVMPTRITISVQGGARRDEVPVSIFNCGQEALSLGAIQLAQGGPEFTLADVPGMGTSIAPQSCPGGTPGAMFRVIFDTATVGNYTARVSIASSDPVDPTVYVDVEASKR
jgi:hypothetical protein